MGTRTDSAWVFEGVCAAVAAYAHALDRGDSAAVAALFCPDGVSEVEGAGVFEGRASIEASYAKFVVRRPQLHLVSNTVITSRTAVEAVATSDLVFLQRGSAGWAVRLVGRYDDVLHRHDDAWRFHHRKATFLS
jgi:uncharacterized protein (TIGR02246 family)